MYKKNVNLKKKSKILIQFRGDGKMKNGNKIIFEVLLNDGVVRYVQ